MFVLFCFALLHLPLSSSCIHSGLPIPRTFCVFSCACPSPSRSQHRGAHSDPPGGETSEDQSPAQTGGGQRYGSEQQRISLGAVWFHFMKTETAGVQATKYHISVCCFFFCIVEYLPGAERAWVLYLGRCPLACVLVILLCVLLWCSATICSFPFVSIMHACESFFLPRPPCFSWPHFYEPA